MLGAAKNHLMGKAVMVDITESSDRQPFGRSGEQKRIGYLLRQKVIEVETETQEANDAMIVAVNWLNRLSIHFEEFCQRIDPELHFSPKPFNHPVLVSHCTIGSEKLTHKC